MSFLKRIKAVYWFNNLLNRKKLDCNEDVYKKYGLTKSTNDLLSSKDFDSNAVTDIPWLDQENAAEQLSAKLAIANFSDSEKEKIKGFSKDGYIILEKAFSGDEVETILSEIESLKKTGKAKHRDDERIIFAIHKSEKIYELATKKKITHLLDFLLGKKAKLFQSLNFEHGSAQRAHSDTIHMTTYPLGYLVAVWVALEDIHPDSGPLFYYPGSHKLPYVLNDDYNHGGNYFLLGPKAYQKYEDAIQEVIENNKLKKEIFCPKKGDAFIWHANILHGGSRIKNSALTRKSMVLHFYAEDVICYHEITQRPAIFNGEEAHCPS
jgi:ectoine hydroxylase-related dioxygenase (phytanoyl-CoA dioxygenase family)